MPTTTRQLGLPGFIGDGCRAGHADDDVSAYSAVVRERPVHAVPPCRTAGRARQRPTSYSCTASSTGCRGRTRQCQGKFPNRTVAVRHLVV